MGVVDVDGDLIRQVFQRAVLGQVVLGDIPDGRGRQEILLAQTEDLALDVVVVGVQHLADELGVGALGDGAAVLARVEAVHIEAGRLGLPQAQLGNAVGIVPGHIHVAGYGDDAGIVFVLHMVVYAVPALLDLSVKAHLHGLVRMAFQPHAAAGQPVVGAFLLPAVHDLLLEDAVFVQDGIARAGDIVGGHTVQIARGQTAQAAVAQARVRLLLVDIVQLHAVIPQHLVRHAAQAQIKQAGLQAAAHQKFHAQVIHLLAVGAVGARDKALALFAEHAPCNECKRAVDLFVRCRRDVDGEFIEQLFSQQLFKFFFGISGVQNYLLLFSGGMKNRAHAGRGQTEKSSHTLYIIVFFGPYFNKIRFFDGVNLL